MALGRVKLSPRRHSTRHFRPPEAVHVVLGEGVRMPFELQDQGLFNTGKAELPYGQGIIRTSHLLNKGG